MEPAQLFLVAFTISWFSFLAGTETRHLQYLESHISIPPTPAPAPAPSPIAYDHLQPATNPLGTSDSIVFASVPGPDPVPIASATPPAPAPIVYDYLQPATSPLGASDSIVIASVPGPGPGPGPVPIASATRAPIVYDYLQPETSPLGTSDSIVVASVPGPVPIASATPPAPAPIVYDDLQPATSPLGTSDSIVVASVPGPVPIGSSIAPEHAKRQVFSVLSYGAVGDGSTDDTQAFKMAWDSCCQADSGGLLLVPSGHSFLIHPTTFTGPCKNVGLVFQIDGTIMPPDGPDTWPSANKKRWIVFYGIDGMVMHGGGVIDGRGEKWWNLPCKPHRGINGTTLPGPCDSPVAITFFMSSNLAVRGLRVKNSPQFHFRFDDCQDVHIKELNIKSPAQSPNTDGIHIENTTNVLIHHSIIFNGDDCVSIGADCRNVHINNVTCGPSHGISIGSLGVRNTQACVSNVTVTDCVIRHSDNGVRIKTWQGGSGSVSKVTFKNIHMENVRNPIIIDQYYCPTKGCTNQSSAVHISGIWYTNIKGTYNITNPPVRLACSDSVPCTNLVMSEVELLPAQGQKVADPFCWKAYGSMQSVTIPPLLCLLDGNPRYMGQTSPNDSCR